MLNANSDVTYSSQKVSGRRRILATQDGDTRTVVTLNDDTATEVARELTKLVADRRVTLYRYGQEHTGQVCELRRALMGTVLAGPTSVSPTFIDTLATALAACSDAEKRAVADEVGRLYAGTQDVIVPAPIEGEFGDSLFLCVANDWLTDATDPATDDDILTLIEGLDSGPLFEGMLAHARVLVPELEDALEAQWHNVSIDTGALVAWTRRNRPHLNDQLVELVEE